MILKAKIVVTLGGVGTRRDQQEGFGGAGNALFLNLGSGSIQVFSFFKL